jgi:hypothetical protein
MNKKGYVELIALGLVAIIALGGLVWISGTSTTGQVVSRTTCTDTDGGMIFGVKGTVTYAGGRTATDTCTRSGISAASGPAMMEMYCTPSGGLGRTAYTCPRSCVNGACV